MSHEVIHRLTKFFSIPRQLEAVKTVAKMDRHSLAIRYRELIEQGYVKNQADLARHLGVSRAWVTKVMNELKHERKPLTKNSNFNGSILTGQSV